MIHREPVRWRGSKCKQSSSGTCCRGNMRHATGPNPQLQPSGEYTEYSAAYSDELGMNACPFPSGMSLSKKVKRAPKTTTIL